MLTLNIIPQKIKKQLKVKLIYSSLKNIYLIIILCLSLYGIALLVSAIILNLHFITTIHETTLLTKNVQNYNRQVNGVNQQINYIESIQSEAIEWSYLLVYLKNISSQGITIQHVAAAQDTKLSISGHAQTRDNLIIFKETLEKSDSFNNIDFPIKNLLKKDNINFVITADLNSYDFTQL